jgi:hypothetical protein
MSLEETTRIAGELLAHMGAGANHDDALSDAGGQLRRFSGGARLTGR